MGIHFTQDIVLQEEEDKKERHRGRLIRKSPKITDAY